MRGMIIIFFDGSGYIPLVSRSVAITEENLEIENSQLGRAKKMLLQRIPDSDPIEIFRWKTVKPNKLRLEPSNSNEDIINGRVDNLLQQSPAT